MQINGKVRDKMMVAAGMDRDALQEFVMQSDSAKRLIGEKTVVKVIAVPQKLVNIVVR